MTKIKVGYTVTIKNGQEIARQCNPTGNIKVKVIEILEGNRFRGITEFNNRQYIYHNEEVIDGAFIFR